MENAFSRIYKITNFPKLRSFQYRKLLGRLNFNKQLALWNVIKNDKCTLCQKEPEDMFHFYFSCKVSLELRKEVKSLIAKTYKDEYVKLSPKDIFFCSINKECIHIANFICLLVKQELYVNRCLKKETNITQITLKINRIKSYELYNAKKNNKVKTHIKKWHLTNHSGRTQVLYTAHVLYCALFSRSCFFFSGNC